MPVNRWADWWAQAQRDLEAGRASLRAGYYEWAAFQAHQAAEKALKALAMRRGGMAWGHSLLALARGLGAPDGVLAMAKGLELLYVPTRYPNGLPEGHPGEFFSRGDAEEALRRAEGILAWVGDNLG